MEKLLIGKSAYKILSGDARESKLSHAYMLYFADTFNLRAALKLFARNFFPADRPSQIDSEGLTDLKVYPPVGEKLTVEAATQIVEGSAVKPVAHDKKLYIISHFDSASPVFQNKLLKVLEEPPQGVYFLLGVTSLSPVLATVRSRVKLLEVPPFTANEVYSALEREGANPQNREVAEDCGGCLGIAQNMLKGDWYGQVKTAAEEICSANTLSKALKASLKYGDFKYKKELLTEMQRLYFKMVTSYANDVSHTDKLTKGAALYAVESVNKALSDVIFNANFSSLLYDLLIRIARRCEKESK